MVILRSNKNKIQKNSNEEITKTIVKKWDINPITEYDKLDSIYENPINPASFSGINRLYLEAQKKFGKKEFSKKNIKKYLSSKISYTRHFPARHIFKRRKIYAFAKDDIWQLDLLSVENIKQYNNNVTFILVCVDTLSGWICCEPIKNKTGQTVTNAFQNILKKSKRKPKLIYSDLGKEFYNKNFFNLMKNDNITLYSTHNREIKASHVERKIRQLKNKIYKYMTENENRRYIDVLEDICTSLNLAFNRIIKMAPNDVTTKNEKKVFNNRYNISKEKLIKKRYKFKINDQVRIAIPRNVFTRGFRPTFSNEIFDIKERLPTNPHVYRVSFKGENDNLDKAYYSAQMVLQTGEGLTKKTKIFPVKKRAI